MVRHTLFYFFSAFSFSRAAKNASHGGQSCFPCQYPCALQLSQNRSIFSNKEFTNLREFLMFSCCKSFIYFFFFCSLRGRRPLSSCQTYRLSRTTRKKILFLETGLWWRGFPLCHLAWWSYIFTTVSGISPSCMAHVLLRLLRATPQSNFQKLLFFYSLEGLLGKPDTSCRWIYTEQSRHRPVHRFRSTISSPKNPQRILLYLEALFWAREGVAVSVRRVISLSTLLLLV